ncbi:MAG: PEP-CTERM system histidine kinase PrsK [Verrucomicrobiales bacterium]|nr:PEP-CTERM system histidine kinase PrsK [Verrucomicrobiales bacterium]
MAVAIFALALGVAVIWRSPRHPAHLSFGVGMLILAGETVTASLAVTSFTAAEALPYERLRLALAALLPVPWIVFSRCYSRGDALLALRQRWRQAVIGTLAAGAFVGAFYGALAYVSRNPTSRLEFVALGWAGLTVEIGILLTSVLVLMNLERTFRGSVGVMRWRIKYMVLGVGALFGFRLYAASQALLFQIPEEPISRAGAAALGVACVLMSVSLSRGTVFDVDVYPSQSLVYRSLTVVLAGLYLLIVGVLSHLVTVFGGTTAFPIKALLVLVALTGLAAMMLSERLRRQLRQFVSRHLRRPVYDYRGVWSTFTAQTTSLVEEGAFSRKVASWISDTFQALSSSVWLVEESGERLRLGGSTVLVDATADRLDQPAAELREALAGIAQLKEPTVIDPDLYPWAATLIRLHPGVFPAGGSRICQPLIAGGRLLGLLTLGDRVAGAPFTTEDFDLLKCVADQIAASLLGLQLSAQQVRSKEMEAFQTMSAFFVHDLKNTASTLSLTLQNLHQHFSDPAFRDDALRAVGKSVQHLNTLIARLTRLRQELRVQPVPTDLPAMVEACIQTLGPTPNLQIRREFSPLPPVQLDSEQFQKVILNLLLNSREAISHDGEIRVATESFGGWAVVSVSDNGCGMSPEFIQKSLFRPFQTTKKNGLGIGMFHSKMIVEAHRGRLEVQSTQGKGTTVRVLLPLTSTV